MQPCRLIADTEYIKAFLQIYDSPVTNPNTQFNEIWIYRQRQGRNREWSGGQLSQFCYKLMNLLLSKVARAGDLGVEFCLNGSKEV